MDLNEYIKMSYKRPNSKVFEGVGASEALIEYLMETPWNTNWNVIGSIEESGDEDIDEVWLISTTYQDMDNYRLFSLSNVDEHDYITELLENGENYKIFLNGEELQYSVELPPSTIGYAWADGVSEETTTKSVSVYNTDGMVYPLAIYLDASIAPTSVEVSVKVK